MGEMLGAYRRVLANGPVSSPTLTFPLLDLHRGASMTGG